MRPMNSAKLTRVVFVATTLLSTSGNVSAQDFSPRDAKGTALSTDWQNGSGTVTLGADGKIVFLYGEVQPAVVCSPLQICDIELEAGELVRNVLVGDSVRWKVEPAMSGSKSGESVHLIVKPSEPDLQTSMIVTTSKRTYHIELKSHETRYMARVGFAYSDDINARLSALGAQIEGDLVPGAGLPADQLDFSFELLGKASWKPVRVYADGQKTYIQFPSTLVGQDAPVLFVTSGAEDRIVNYRLKGSMMVVDFYIDQAVLISGVGKSQQKIAIRRRS